MPRWLAVFEVEGHLGVDASQPELVYRHPRGEFTLHLKNLNMEPGCQVPTLSAFVLFEGGEIEAAEPTGKAHLRDFLDLLGLATGSRFRVLGITGVFDWSPGISERAGIVFSEVPDPDVPQLLLTADLVGTVDSLLALTSDRDLMRATHWFRAAASADALDEQFQLFWFSIEIMARKTRSVEKVTSDCPRCGSPLYCQQCEDAPKHRPYPSQAIQQLFARHLTSDADRLYKAASSMRHALLHADDVERAVDEGGMQLGELVDLVGRLAWASLISVARTQVEPPPGGRLGLIEPSTFRHRYGQARAEISFMSPEGREIEFSDIPTVRIETTVTED